MENFENTYQQENLQIPVSEGMNGNRQPVYAAVPAQTPADTRKKVRSSKKGGVMRFFKVLISSILILALVVTGCLVTAVATSVLWSVQLSAAKSSMNKEIKKLEKKVANGSQTTVVVPDGEIPEEGLTSAQVYAMNVDAVVAITSQAQTTNIFGQVSQTASAGSGFIISSDGYVVTNFHVISGATKVGVILSDGTEYQAAVIGYDKTNDVAVLKIEGTDFPCVTMGSSNSLVVGERVAAIGNPLGELSSTLTVGYVSAKDRMINTDGVYQNMIQTDAAINSGNSGGPLFDMQGEVIGITTAKYSGTSASGATIEGIGFAIPIDDVRNLIDDLKEYGYIKSGYLGIMAQDVAMADAEQYGLPLGALVVEVTPGSCAERGGLKTHDIITAVDDVAIKSMSDLSRALTKYEGGEEIDVTVYRNGSETVLSITLDAKPVEETQAQPQQESQSSGYIPDWMNPFG